MHAWKTAAPCSATALVSLAEHGGGWTTPSPNIRWSTTQQLPGDAPAFTDYRDRYEALTGRSLWQCPRCHEGTMRVVECLVGTRARPAILDSS